jgi:hypothetical protein
VEENIIFALWMHGEKIHRRDNPEGDPISREQALAIGQRHCLEFTVTLPGTGCPYDSGREFGKVWDKFNRKYLIPAAWCDTWLQIKEAHKSGFVHAHCLILTTRDTWKAGRPPKWYKNQRTGKQQVIGRTCADWIPTLWEKFRSGLLNRYGLGTRHTLQPIQDAGKFSKYLSKYLTKGFKEQRPEHLKHLRLVNYAQNFPRACRVFWYKRHQDPGGKEARRLIHYMTKEKRGPTGEIIEESKPAKRWEMATAFSFNGPAGRYRRKRLADIAANFQATDYSDLPRLFGPKFAYYLEPLLCLSNPPGEDWTILEEGALAYKIAGIERFTPFDPQMVSPDGYRATLAELDRMQDQEKARTYRFAWLFQDRISGNMINADKIGAKIGEYFIAYYQRAQKKARRVASGDHDRTRTTDSELYPMPTAYF